MENKEVSHGLWLARSNHCLTELNLCILYHTMYSATLPGLRYRQPLNKMYVFCSKAYFKILTSRSLIVLGALMLLFSYMLLFFAKKKVLFV